MSRENRERIHSELEGLVQRVRERADHRNAMLQKSLKNPNKRRINWPRTVELHRR